MARAALSAARARFRAVRDRWLLPEADSANEHWQRIRLIQSVDARLAALGPPTLTAAEISGSAHATKPWKRYVSLNYPEFDLCAPLGQHERYDVVICEQVLEHVIDPWTAAENLRGLCNPGGHVVVSTPFLVRIHDLPAYGMPDYWRFTRDGLRVLLERAGLEVELVESWGNRSSVVGNFDRWPAYRRWHSLRNEPDLPLQVWAFTRNPLPRGGPPGGTAA